MPINIYLIVSMFVVILCAFNAEDTINDKNKKLTSILESFVKDTMDKKSKYDNKIVDDLHFHYHHLTWLYFMGGTIKHSGLETSNIHSFAAIIKPINREGFEAIYRSEKIKMTFELKDIIIESNR